MKTLFVICLLLVTNNLFGQTPVYEWTKTMGDFNQETGESVVVDASGNIITTGWFREAPDFDPNAGVFNLSSNGASDCYIQKLDANGNLLWAKQLGSASEDIGRSVDIDAQGNIYVVGYFEETVDFNPGPGTANLTSNGGSDIFILKLNPNGIFQWAKHIGGTIGDRGSEVKIDQNGDVLVTGKYHFTADFNPGQGTVEFTSNGSGDIFVLKLDANGDFIWAKSVGGPSDDQGLSIASDATNNVYITGFFRQTVDFDPGSGTESLSSQGVTDMFVQKLDANGNFVWATSVGGTTEDVANSITVDQNSNVYTTGEFNGTVDFDPGPGVSNLVPTFSGIFLQKLDGNGNFVWAEMIDDIQSFSDGYDVCVDGSGNIYTTGFFGFQADFDPGSGVTNLVSNGNNDIFIQKLDTDGNYLWAISCGGPESDRPYSITVDQNDNVYTTGRFRVTADFDPFSSTDEFTSNGSNDVFIQKFSQQDFTNLGENSFEATPTLHPNPSNGSFVVNFGANYSNVLMTVSDVQGKVVQTVQLNQATECQFEIEQSAGLYFVDIQLENKQVRLKAIKQ